jgi:hypothetical protein
MRQTVRHYAKQFGIRFLIVFAILGSLYGGFVAYQYHRRQPTPSQKLAVLHDSLVQTVLTGSQLAAFKQSDPLTASTLSTQFSRFQAAVTSLDSSLNAVPTDRLNGADRAQIRQFIEKQQAVTAAYKLISTRTALPLSYDPESDLSRLNIVTDTQKIISRATAAQKGLTTAAKNTDTKATGSSLDGGGLVAQAGQSAQTLISDASRQALTASADCFGRLATQLMTKLPTAGATRVSCVHDYPAVRAVLVRNILDDSFNKAYSQDLTKITPLLRRLNQ